MAIRMEVCANDPNYLWWIGDGAKTLMEQGIFSITNTGDAHFGGRLNGNIIRYAESSPKFGASTSMESGQIATYGRGRKVVASINYYNTGTIGSVPGGTPQATLRLERRPNSSADWTVIAMTTVTGSLTSVGGEVEVRLDGSLTFTDNVAWNDAFRYRVSTVGSGPWPITTSNGMGRQRLSLITTEA